MVWFVVDDSFAEHPKVLSIPRTPRLQVVGLWTTVGTWAARQMTDGLVSPDLVIEKGGRTAHIKALVEAGLWHGPDSSCDHDDSHCPGVPGKGQLTYHDWFDYQRSRQEILDGREKKAAAGRAGGKASGASRRGKPGSKGEASALAGASSSFADRSQSVEPPFPFPHPYPKPSLVTLVRRRLFGDTRDATTTNDLVPLWQAAAGKADLEVELRNWLLRNASTDLRDPSAALLGWLAKAAERAATPGPRPVIGCGDCDRGWLADDPHTGMPRPCPACKPHTRRTEAI